MRNRIICFQREKCICLKPDLDDDAIISLSVHNIKISKRDGDEVMAFSLLTFMTMFDFTRYNARTRT